MPYSLSFTRSLLLTVVVALGIALAWLVVAAWTIGLAQAATRQQTYEHLYLGADGQPLIVRTTSSRGGYNQEVFSLDRERIETAQRHRINYPGYMVAPQYAAAEGAAWNSRLVAANDGGSPAVNWYLVHDGRVSGRAYGVGYQSDSARVVGYFGKQGFSERQPPREEWFQVFGERGLGHVSTGVTVREPTWNNPYQEYQGLVLLADGKVWNIDLAQRRLAALADCPNALAIGWLRPPYWAYSLREPMHTAKLLVWQRDRLKILDRETGEQASLPLPAGMGPFLAVYELPDNRLLLISYDSGRVDDGHRLVWLDRQGEVLEERIVQTLGYRGASPGAAATAWAGAVSAPYPLASLFLAVIYPLQQAASGQAARFDDALADMLRETWPATLLVLILSGLAAADAYRRQRHYALPHPLGWAVFVFLMGLPGWLAHRLHRTWPALESCHACHQPAPIDRASCPDCGVAVPPPPLAGIEVFA